MFDFLDERLSFPHSKPEPDSNTNTWRSTQHQPQLGIWIKVYDDDDYYYYFGFPGHKTKNLERQTYELMN